MRYAHVEKAEREPCGSSDKNDNSSKIKQNSLRDTLFFVVVVCLFVFKILWALPGWVTQPHFSVLLLIGTIGYSSSSYGYFFSVVESFCQESQE